MLVVGADSGSGVFVSVRRVPAVLTVTHGICWVACKGQSPFQEAPYSRSQSRSVLTASTCGSEAQKRKSSARSPPGAGI